MTTPEDPFTLSSLRPFHTMSLSIILLSLPFIVHAHGGMDMGDGTTTGTGMMTPWFHFSTGDPVWFDTWMPTSKGALAGACIGLFLLAVVERWIAAMRAVVEVWWKRKAQSIVALRFSRNKSMDGEKGLPLEIDTEGDRPYTPNAGPIPTLRSAAPFIPSHDFARGAMQAAQATLGYALMLAVMTCNAGYILSIVAGIGTGEVLFGRFAYVGAHLH